MRPRCIRFLLWTGAVLDAQVLAPEFNDSLVAAVSAPTALAFLPDGRILVASQGGSLRVVQNDRLSPEPALTIPAASICGNSERGLLGIAVDPRFTETGFVYLYYTYRGPGKDCGTRTSTTPVNRVSRWVMSSSGRIDPSTKTVLIDDISSYGGNHNGGDLKFDRDGNLLVSVGDAGCDYKGTNRCAGANDAARERHTLLGKILRIDRDGGIPAGGNPWSGLPGAIRCHKGNGRPGQLCEETYLWGLRNPYRIAARQETKTVFVNDVGQNAWEEIDEGVAGSDYGWNAREGFCANGSVTDCTTAPMTGTYRNPVYAYRHSVTVPGTQSSGCSSLAGANLTIRDSVGVERNADVLFTSETQLNFLVPPGTALGGATLRVSRGGIVVATTVADIRSCWPGIFTANGDGAGVPAATAVRVTGTVQQPVPVYDCPQGVGSCVPVPIDVSGGNVYLSLYGTGIRGGQSVSATAGGTALEVVYAGPQNQYPGLGQVNVRLPAELAGRGEIPLIVGGTANVGQPIRIAIR